MNFRASFHFKRIEENEMLKKYYVEKSGWVKISHAFMLFVLNSYCHRFQSYKQTLSVIKSYHWYSDGQFSRQLQVSKLMSKLHNFVAAAIEFTHIARNIGSPELNASQYIHCVQDNFISIDRFIMGWCTVLHLHEPLSKSVRQTVS